MNQKTAQEIARKLKEFRMKGLGLSAHDVAAITLDDRVIELEKEKKRILNMASKERLFVILDAREMELEAQRDELLEACRTILNGMDNVRMDNLRDVVAKYDKDLPKFKDITGLYDTNTEGVTLEKNPKE